MFEIMSLFTKVINNNFYTIQLATFTTSFTLANNNHFQKPQYIYQLTHCQVINLL